MKYINKLASVFFMAALAMLTMTSCEGGDLYNVGAPDWLAEMGGEEEDESSIISVTPNPTLLGNTDNTTPWWTVFTDDVQAEAGKTYQVKFLNYGGSSNWTNFLIILRNANKNVEYAVLRSDNWGWTSADTDGANSDNYFSKKMENSNRDWAEWLKGMSLAKVTATIYNNGDGSADVKITMVGSNNNTYTQEYNGISVDKDDMYFSFTCEGSHLDFANFDVEDSEPTAIVLNGVAAKVLQGTTFEDAFANVTATVTFAEGVTKTVEASELQIQAIPDMQTLGKKTLVAVYNKTYMGNSSANAVIGTATFEVVDKMYTCVGATDNSGDFWSAHSDNIKVAAGETFVSTFTNYTSGASNWNNFCVVLCAADNSEYAVVRADNFGWGAGYDGNANLQLSGGQSDWAAWLKAMDGAKVTAYITNNGNGTADVECKMLGNDGVEYIQWYKGITINSDDFYFRYTIDHSHIEFDDVYGAENNTGDFWSAHSAAINVPVGKTYTQRFKNYTSGQSNWNNFCVVLTREDASEYAVVRADNFGWGASYDGNSSLELSGGQTDWAGWLKAMDEAKVTVSTTNKGGSVDVDIKMVGNDGITYTQYYHNITPTDGDNVYFHFTVDHSHFVFE